MLQTGTKREVTRNFDKPFGFRGDEKFGFFAQPPGGNS